jgi:hypothetical protein
MHTRVKLLAGFNPFGKVRWNQQLFNDLDASKMTPLNFEVSLLLKVALLVVVQFGKVG